MEVDSQVIVALKSKQQALFYFESGNLGRAFAHFLVAIKLMPEWKTELKTDFSSTLCAWGRKLEEEERFTDLFNCYEQATEIFPENEEVFCNLGAHLFRLGHLREAAHYFRQALDINDSYLPAYRNTQNVCNALVERWHYRMLNDSHRNEAYREAILKKVRQGFISVLDIGTGTGILSLYAVTSGAKQVHACDYSATMCTIAREVLEANKMADRVQLIHKLSNNLTIPEDLPHRKSLVVTETMDSGLLGEHVLQTLIHAWENLLRPFCPDLRRALEEEEVLTQHGVVVPFGARLWATPVRSETIARRSYLLPQPRDSWPFNHVLFNNSSEPYDTENLRNIKDCKFLCDPVLVFSFNFNNPLELKDFYNGEKDGKIVSFTYEGKSDALAVWFDVVLDEDITISSAPFSTNEQCCWDQAIFRFKHPQENVKIIAKCGGGILGFEIVSEVSPSLENLNLTAKNEKVISEIGVSAEIISFMNNKELQTILYSVPENFETIKSVLDTSPFPMLGLRFLQLKGTNVVCALKTMEEVKAVKAFVKDNDLDFSKVKCLLKDEVHDLFNSSVPQFDFIFNNLFELTGELSESNINNIPRLMKLMVPGGTLAPLSLSVFCQLVDCEWIRRVSTVTNEELTQIYRITEFINVFQVSQQLDIDLRNVSYTPLSEATSFLELCHEEMVSKVCLTRVLTLKAVQDGFITAIPVWYQYRICDGIPPVSTLSENSHLNQVVFVVDPPLDVKCGQTVSVNVSYQCGILRLKILP